MTLMPPAGVLLHTGYLTCRRASTGWVVHPRGVESIRLPSIHDPREIEEHIREDDDPFITPYAAKETATRVLTEIQNLNPTCQVELHVLTVRD